MLTPEFQKFMEQFNRLYSNGQVQFPQPQVTPGMGGQPSAIQQLAMLRQQGPQNDGGDFLNMGNTGGLQVLKNMGSGQSFGDALTNGTKIGQVLKLFGIL